MICTKYTRFDIKTEFWPRTVAQRSFDRIGVDERVVLQGRKCPRSQSLLALSCNHSNEGTLLALVTKESVVVMITQVTTRTIAERATFVTKVCNVSNQISYKCTYVFTHSAPLFLPSITKTEKCQRIS